MKDLDAEKTANALLYYMQRVTTPPRLASNVLLVHESIDQISQPRMAWLYNAGQRRVRRAPQVAYDGPGTAADGLATVDNFDMCNGAPDRYQWRLLGKREMGRRRPCTCSLCRAPATYPRAGARHLATFVEGQG